MKLQYTVLVSLALLAGCHSMRSSSPQESPRARMGGSQESSGTSSSSDMSRSSDMNRDSSSRDSSVGSMGQGRSESREALVDQSERRIDQFEEQAREASNRPGNEQQVRELRSRINEARDALKDVRNSSAADYSQNRRQLEQCLDSVQSASDQLERSSDQR